MNKATLHWMVDTVARTIEKHGADNMDEVLEDLMNYYISGRFVFTEYELAIRVAHAMVS